MELERSLSLIRRGSARVDLDRWRPVMATGEDARGFLHDLLTADVATLETGRSRRAFLLTPTGRIRADVTVAALPDGLLLVQAPDQPEAISDLLAPYVLSASVELVDRSDHLRIVAYPGATPDGGPDRYSPSALGAGTDVVLPPSAAGRDLPGTEIPAGHAAAWRVMEGIARFPADLTDRSLPNEAGLDGRIDVEKGCFMGQEAVAKVRDRGHPTHAVLAVAAGGPLAEGEEVRVDGRPVGSVTSAASGPARSAGIVRVRWDAREASLVTAAGVPLEGRGLASGPA